MTNNSVISKSVLDLNRKLGRFETAQVLTDWCAPFNVVVAVRLGNGPTMENIKRALNMLSSIHPALRVRIIKKKSKYLFKTRDTGFIPIVFLPQDKQNHWLKITEDELNTRFEIENTPLIRFTCLYNSSQNMVTDIIVTFHHTIVDATSGIHFLHQLLLLCAKKDSDPDKFIFSQKENTARWAAEKYFPEHFKGISGFRKRCSFILRQANDEITYKLKTRKRPQPGINMITRNRIISLKLSKDFTTALIKKTRKERVTLNNSLIFAQLAAVQELLYTKEENLYRIFTFPNLRPYLKPLIPDSYLGSYFSMMRITFPVNNHQDFWTQTKSLNDVTNKAYRRGDKFIFNHMSEQIMRMMINKKNQRMGTTALSYTGPVIINSRYGKTKVKDIHAFVSNLGLGPEFCAQARIFHRQLCWDFIYLDADMDASLAKEIINKIGETLKKAVRHMPGEKKWQILEMK